MQYRIFSRTGINVSEIGYGAWGIGPRKEGSRKGAEKEELLLLEEEEAFPCVFASLREPALPLTCRTRAGKKQAPDFFGAGGWVGLRLTPACV